MQKKDTLVVRGAAILGDYSRILLQDWNLFLPFSLSNSNPSSLPTKLNTSSSPSLALKCCCCWCWWKSRAQYYCFNNRKHISTLLRVAIFKHHHHHHHHHHFNLNRNHHYYHQRKCVSEELRLTHHHHHQDWRHMAILVKLCNSRVQRRNKLWNWNGKEESERECHSSLPHNYVTLIKRPPQHSTIADNYGHNWRLSQQEHNTGRIHRNLAHNKNCDAGDSHSFN